MNRSESRYFATAARMDEAFLTLLAKKDFKYITIKEICEVAGVNRSTFYLHYETMSDLLSESVSRMNEQFHACMEKDSDAFSAKLRNCPRDELYLITPDYLTPYLSYIKNNKRLFRTAIENAAVLGMDKSYDRMFRHVFTPILDRYGVLPQDRPYIMAFYIRGLMAIISEWLKNDCTDSITDEEAQELYAAEKDVLLGIINWVERTIETIAQMEREESDPAVKKNLREMLEANRQILKGPARNLREACQWISWYNMAERTYCRAGAGCQLDCTLLPYYEKSVAEGMTDDEATFILACFLLCDPHYYQIGGPAADGSDNTNHLSYLILEAAHQLKSTANITIRVFDNMDEGLFRRGLEILFEDRLAYPRFSGDKALVSGFMKNGYSAELARRRIALGCNWMSLPGLEYTMNDLVKINMAKVFEVAFQEYQGDDLAEFYDVFRKDLLEAIACIKAGIDFHLKNQYRNAPELLLNLVSHGPIEKGRDASHGGLQYYNIAIDGAGIATVADSFAALELHCCEKKDLSWDQVRNAIAVNFEGPEADAVRRILKNTPMYGYGGTEADGWALRISRFFTERISQERTPEGHLTIPGLFSWANTVPFGKQVGATPNGRRAGEPINHGANPNNGFRKDGAFTAAAKAIAAVQPGYGNTAPFQLELNDTIIDRENAIENVAAVLKGHFDMGGTLVNVNIVDKDQILAANEDPSAYPNLIVRVTGFTAYFSALSPEFRQLVVDRIISL